jgi:hypothetical protein
MRMRAAALAYLPGGLPGQLGDPGSRLAAGFLGDDPTGVAALWE